MSRSESHMYRLFSPSTISIRKQYQREKGHSSLGDFGGVLGGPFTRKNML